VRRARKLTQLVFLQKKDMGKTQGMGAGRKLRTLRGQERCAF